MRESFKHLSLHAMPTHSLMILSSYAQIEHSKRILIYNCCDTPSPSSSYLLCVFFLFYFVFISKERVYESIWPLFEFQTSFFDFSCVFFGRLHCGKHQLICMLVLLRCLHTDVVVIVAFMWNSNDLIGHLLIARNGLSSEIVKSTVV